FTWSGSTSPIYSGLSDAGYFSNPNAEYWRAAMDHIEHSGGHEWAFKGDVAYKFLDDVPFLKQLKVGGRWADRKQTIRSTTYNWAALSEVWAGNAPVTIQQGGVQNATFFTFPDFFRGATPGPVGGYYYGSNPIDDYAASSAYFKAISQIWNTTNGAAGTSATTGIVTPQTTWVPLAERAGVI